MLIDKDSTQDEMAERRLKVIVPVLPYISNNTDFDVLRVHPNVDLQFVQMGDYIPKVDLLILPSSTNVTSDIQSLKDYGWGRALTNQLRHGGKVIGVGSGFQMLGNTIYDPYGLGGSAGSQDGFGWLMVETTLEKAKPLKPVAGKLRFIDVEVTGDEAHIGVSIGPALSQPVLMIVDGESLRPEGAMSVDNQVAGTYVHGLFDSPEACTAWLKWAGLAP